MVMPKISMDTVLMFTFAVVTFSGAYFWHLVLFEATYRELGIWTRIDDPIMPLGALAVLIQARIFGYVYVRAAEDLAPGEKGSLLNGAAFGLLFGLLVSSSQVFATLAKSNCTDPVRFVELELCFCAIQFTTAGAVVAWVYKHVPVPGPSPRKIN